MVNFKRLVLGAQKELGVQISVASGSVFVFLLFGLLCTVVQSVIPDSQLFVLQKTYNSRYSIDFTTWYPWIFGLIDAIFERFRHRPFQRTTARFNSTSLGKVRATQS